MLIYSKTKRRAGNFFLLGVSIQMFSNHHLYAKRMSIYTQHGLSCAILNASNFTKHQYNTENITF